MIYFLFAVAYLAVLFFVILCAALSTARLLRKSRHQKRTIKLLQQEVDELEAEIGVLKADVENYRGSYLRLAKREMEALRAEREREDWPDVILEGKA